VAWLRRARTYETVDAVQEALKTKFEVVLFIVCRLVEAT
jgi:hypothetical protein